MKSLNGRTRVFMSLLGLVYLLFAFCHGLKGYGDDGLSAGGVLSAILFALGTAGVPFGLALGLIVFVSGLFAFKSVRLFSTACAILIIALGAWIHAEAWLTSNPEALMGILLQYVLLVICGAIALVWGGILTSMSKNDSSAKTESSQ